ncbi:MAG: NAD(P)-dependent alcohol dehydrogenase [Proteobacteria bacterium]|nr:NAD(P)-dependent alcohol dehydrogenase [Pseudomonadota bacterium]
MKAAVCTRYGPPEVLQLQNVDEPVPGDQDVLIRIHATTVTASDCYIRSGIPSAPLAVRLMMRLVIGFTKPRRPILGAVLAGEVEKIGRKVKRFHVGDRVWAFTLLRMGCYAQRTCLPANFKLLTLAPSNLNYDEAAAIPYGGFLALHFLSKVNIKRGQKVLIYGASGANGTCAVQLAKHFGAEVTAVCSTANIELARSLGADTVLDYTKEQSSALGRYDVVFDAVGRRKTSPMKEALRSALTSAGKYLSVDDELPRIRRTHLVRLKKLVEEGVLKPVIDRQYPLERIVEAHEYVEQGHKRGNVIVTVGEAD